MPLRTQAGANPQNCCAEEFDHYRDISALKGRSCLDRRMEIT